MISKRVENQMLGLTGVVYCLAMLAALAVGLYGVFSLFQLMFNSLEQVSRLTPWATM